MPISMKDKMIKTVRDRLLNRLIFETTPLSGGLTFVEPVYTLEEKVEMKKYKELPAFETNEFKIGDKVAVYNMGISFICTVERIMGEMVYCLPENRMHMYECKLGRDIYNFKQCRKLEENKPREYWLNPGIDSRYPFEGMTYNKHVASDLQLPGWIRVREIIEGDE